MAEKKEKAPNRKMWPVGKSNAEITRTMHKVSDMVRAHGNIGDSLESRFISNMIGGGSDIFSGMFGYSGDFLQQAQYGGEESMPRGNRALLGRSLSEDKMAWVKIKLVRDVYDNDGQVASIVDLMADFATEGINFVHEDKGAQKFYQAWAKKVKLRQKVRRSIIDLLIAGSVFLYKVYAKLSDSEKRAMRRYTSAQRIGGELVIRDEDGNDVVIAPKIQYDSSLRFILDPDNKKNDKELAAEIKQLVLARIKSDGEKIIDKKIKDGEKNVVPWKYLSLNPLQMKPNDDGGWSYLLTKDDMKMLARKAGVSVDETKKTIRVSLPSGISGTIKPIKDPQTSNGYFAEMEIQSERLVGLYWNKYDWSKWGAPGGLVWKAMPTITFKNTLRAMEQKTAQAAINMVYLWKLGDHKEGMIPTLEDYERFADMLKAPSSTLNLLWNSAIEGEVIQPKMQDIFDPNRWEGLRAELTSQFGITQAVVTGEGGNFSSSFISVQGLLERLQSIRDLLIEEWLLPEALVVKNAMSFQKLPKIAFNQMSLRDKTAENNFLMALYDRGIISDETMYEALDKDVDIERSRIKEQEEYLGENDLGRKGPFDANKEQMDFQKESKEKDDEFRDKQFEETKKQNEERVKIEKEKARNPAPQPGGTGGKPPGKTGPQKKKRETKPKNVARLDVEDMIKRFDKEAKAQLCQEDNVKDYRGLSKERKREVNRIVATRLEENAPGFNSWLAFRRAAYIEQTNSKPTKNELHLMMLEAFMEAQTHGPK